jgi:hypothetical protein
LPARIDPVKGHATFLKAASELLKSGAPLRFICIGGGSQNLATRLQALADEIGIAPHVIWTGNRSDMPAILNALDIAALCSDAEGFPNVVGEAMACGVPCVGTDVGDTRHLISDTGFIVPPRDPRALADAWRKLLDARERRRLGAAAARAHGREFQHRPACRPDAGRIRRRMSARVAFPFVGDTIGGSHVSAALLMSELPRLGFSPVAIVHQDGPLLTWLQGRGLDCLRADLPRLSPGAGGIPAVLKIFMIAPQLALFLRKNNFALVHANDGRMITSWMSAARLAGCKTVAHRRTRWSVSRLSDIAFSFAQKVIAISRYVETTLPDSLRGKSVVIANPFERTGTSPDAARRHVVDLIGEGLRLLSSSERCKSRNGPTCSCVPPPSCTGSAVTSVFF